jgi:hypothetical protein
MPISSLVRLDRRAYSSPIVSHRLPYTLPYHLHSKSHQSTQHLPPTPIQEQTAATISSAQRNNTAI